MIKKGISLVIASTLFTSFGQIFLKWGLGTESLINLYLLFGLIFYILAGILLVYSLRFGELSILYPIFATSYVWVALLSYIFLKESLGIIHTAGIITILLGVGILGRGGR